MEKFRILICFALLSINITAQTYSGGSGTKNDPYLISRNADMQTLAVAVNGGNSYSGKYFVLTQDILDEIVTVIGTKESRPFRGNFDGGGHQITVNIESTELYVGVFGYINGAVIQNLGVSGSVSLSSSSSSNIYIGGICGYTSNSTITNCHNIGNVSLSSSFSTSSAFSTFSYAGGVCGYATNTIIDNSNNTGDILGIFSFSTSLSSSSYLLSSSFYIGGICGVASGQNISRCYNMGNVSLSNKLTSNTNMSSISYAGGICGSNSNNTIINCYNVGSISSSASATYRDYNYDRSHTSISSTGGICGFTSGQGIGNCYNTGNISSLSSSSSSSSSAGGICGNLNSSYLNNCFVANSTIIAKQNSTSSTDVSRIIGYVSNSIITNCYALPSIKLNDATINYHGADSKNGKDTDITLFQSKAWIEENLEWDFINAWRFATDESFPVLKKKAEIAFSLSATEISYGDMVTFISSSNHTTTPIQYLSSDTDVAEIVGSSINVKKSGSVTLLAYQAHTDIYTPDTAKVILTINKAPLTIKADNITSIYGDIPQFTCSYNGFVNDETENILDVQPIFSCPGNAQSNVGSYTVSVSGAEAENYTITYQSGELEIIKRDLKVTPNDASRVYGDANPTFTFTYEGFVNGNTASNISVKPTIVTTAARTSPVGNYEISCSGGDATNYTFVEYGKANLEITKAPLTVTAKNTNRPYGTDNPKLELLYSGFKNSETKAVLLEEPQIVTTATQTTSVGEYPLTISGGNAQNYSFVYNNGTLTVNKAPLAITADNLSMIYGDTPPQYTYSYIGFVNNETESILSKKPLLTCPGNSQSNVGNYAITVSGAEADNYSITYKTGQLEIIKRDLRVSPNDASRAYGATNPAFTLSYEGFVNGNSASDISVKPTITTTATQTSPVGNYEITCSGGSSTNYKFIEYGKANLEITKAPLTVTAQNINRTYGSENPKFELSYSGFKNSETKSVLSEEPTITTFATKASSVGEYPLSISGGNAQNYSFEYNNGILNITQAPLFIIADNKTRNEGEPNPEFTLSYNGFKNNNSETDLDELPFIYCTADVHSPVGSYDIQLLGGSDNNYNYTLINGILTIISKTGFKNTEAISINLYPNPVQDYLFIQSEQPIEKVEIYSLTGNLLLREHSFNQKINMQGLPKGMCLVKIYTDKMAVVRQVITL